MKRSLEGGFVFSSALLLYFPGGSTTRCRRYERSTNARRKQAVRWMHANVHAESRSSVFSSECRCEVFLSISLLLGVYDGDKRTC